MDILDDDVIRRGFIDHPMEFPPQPGALAVQALAAPCHAHILTGKAPREDLSSGEVVQADGADILEPRHIRPMLREDAPAERVRLHLVDDLAQAGALEAQLETANSRKQRSDPHRSAWAARLASTRST
tara:strand:+ start:1682 stop:2065 length:384 start_codon:yes stop_codon:yes gene_type:complete